jgi:putative SOS response-associated peptidase YedK
LLTKVHERLPAILTRDVNAAWLDLAIREPEKLLRLLESYASDQMEFYPIILKELKRS